MDEAAILPGVFEADQFLAGVEQRLAELEALPPSPANQAAIARLLAIRDGLIGAVLV